MFVLRQDDIPHSAAGNMKGYDLAKPNHQFEKRQRELAKQKKKEEKRLRKLERVDDPAEGAEGVDSETESDASSEEESSAEETE